MQRYGTEPDPDGPPGSRMLSFRTQTEEDINKKMPLSYSMYQGRFHLPLGFIGGTESRERFIMGGNGWMRRRFGVVIGEDIPGTHLFALEHPTQTAEAVLKMVRVLGMEPPGLLPSAPSPSSTSTRGATTAAAE